MSRDDELRRKQGEEEREADHAREEQERRRRIYYARKEWECPPVPIAERMAIFDAVSAEIAFAERMLRDGLDTETVVGLVMAIRRTDPNSVITISDEAGAHASVEIARMRIDHTLE